MRTKPVFFGLFSVCLAFAGVASAATGATAAVGRGGHVRLAPGLTKGEGTGPGWCTEYGQSGVKGLYSFDDVYACGPDETTGPTPFDSNGDASFQCVELSERFLWAIYGLGVIDVDGGGLVAAYHKAHPSIPVGEPGPSALPQPGDVMSFAEGGPIDSSVGHTAVVISAPNSSGDFKIMSENWNNTAGEETARVDLTGKHDGEVEFSGYSTWNTAPFLELTVAPSHAFELAAQDTNTNLYTYSSVTEKATNLEQGMKAETSPAITALSSGGYQEAFQANTGQLLAVGTDGGYGTGVTMMAGTSPSIAALPGGKFEMAAQGSNGNLYLYSAVTDKATELGLGMRSGTSPSIASSSNGSFEVAFQANTGNLYTYSSTSGATNQEQGMKAGTSPAIAALATGGYQIAFQANTGELLAVGANGGHATGLQMAAGTSPAIAASPAGGWVAAAAGASTDSLYTYSSTTDKATNTGQGMKAGTSPGIAALASGGYQEDFQANTGQLLSVGTDGGYGTGVQMAAGTSPSIAA